MTELVILPYTAVAFSIVARFIFIYLLYTKRSTNIYSLAFCCLSVISSSCWIPYGVIIQDVPIIVRATTEIILLTGSGIYILHNRFHQPKIIPLNINNHEPTIISSNGEKGILDHTFDEVGHIK